MTVDEEVRAEVAAMLPAWVPLAAEEGAAPVHREPLPAPETEDVSAASSSEGEDDAAAGPEQTAPQGDAEHEGWGMLMERTPPPGVGGAAAAAPDDAAATELAGGPADEPAAEPSPTGGHDPGAYPSRGRHVVVAAPLWPRLCEADPDLPAALLRARVFVHLVAEFIEV